ncbi:MAG TPA: TIGR01620 family protein [Thermohalobaculum sp.]|nr:TIGR01620 family protein [Thermohalobaculum sp.]
MNQRRNGSHRDPVILDLDETPLPDAPVPADAPPLSGPGLTAAERVLAATRGRHLSGLARLFWVSLSGLVLLWAGLSLNNFVAGLIASRPWAGWLALGLTAVLGATLLAFALGELAALARLRRVDRLRERARAALEDGSPEGLDATLRGLDRLYANRPELEMARAAVARAKADTPDGAAMLAIAERAILAPLDRLAEERAAAAARQVAAATALIPMALIDMAAVLLINLRMIRAIAELYDGRAGWIGSWRLLRAVAAHLAATGAISATDDLLGPLVGGGVLGKLSRRFGEAAVNAALTARVAVATIEVCRPLPFKARPAPKARSIVMAALKGWRGEAGTTPAAGD